MSSEGRGNELARRVGGGILISVIIPAFNEEAFIAPCLESLKRQSFRGAYEIIVVDNASTDRTSDVARSAGAAVVFEPHLGITWARQRGLEAARGEIIAFVDADSRVGPHWLERIWNDLDRDPGAVAVGGQVIYDKGRGFAGNLPHWFAPTVFWVEHVLCRFLRKPAGFWGANFAARRSAVIAAGGFNRSVHFHGEDAELAVRLGKIGRILFDTANVVRTSPRRYEGKGAAGRIWTQLSASARFLVAGERIEGGPVQRGRRLRLRPAQAIGLAWCAVAVVVAVALYLAVAPSAQIYGAVFSRGAQRAEKVLALSFDDGPDEPYTSEVLDILEAKGIKATFFLIGDNVEAYPETVARIVRAGHVIANHTYKHTYLLPFAGFGPIRREVDRTEEIIYKLTGLRTGLFRPPHGLRTPWYIRDLKALDYRVVTWTDMTDDYVSRTKPDEIVKRIVARAHPGDIIDLHDGRDTVHGADRSNTVKALPAIIDALRGAGFTFETVPELLHVPAYKGGGVS